MKLTPRAFISATSDDLASFRKVVKDALETNGILPVEQTIFPPDFRTVAEMLESKIRDCDVVICLIGFAYGSGPAGYPPDTSPRSYTQMEFDIARRMGKPIYVFLAREECPFDSQPVEDDDKCRLQLDHRETIRASNQIWEEFSDSEHLRQRIAHIQINRPLQGQTSPQNLPYVSLGSLFKGREEFLRNLRQKLLTQFDREGPVRAVAVTQRQVIHGLGGVGKTRFAVEYAWHYSSEYSALLFVTADTPENLRHNLATLTGPLVLNLHEAQSGPEEEVKVAAAIRWLVEHPGWFLILDNVDTREAAQAVEELLARLYGGHVLITSRISEWSKDIESLELDVLAVEDATSFLLERTATKRRITTSDNSDASILARELDGLALALEQAGAFIERQRCTLADYLQRWHVGEQRLREWLDPRLMKYPRSVAVTWETTMREVGPAGYALLRLMAWLAPNPIPEWLIEEQEFVSILNSFVETVKPDSSIVDPTEALIELAAYSMVKRGTGEAEPVFTIHRLVQEITRQHVPESYRHKLLEGAINWLNLASPSCAYDAVTWDRWNPLHPHVSVLVNQADEAGIHQPSTCRLMNELGNFRKAKGLYHEAEPLLRRSLELRERILGPDHPDTLAGSDDLGEMLFLKGEQHLVEPYFRRALEGRERVLGADHPDTLTSVNNMALLMSHQGDDSAAEPLLRRALEGSERTLGLDHRDTIISVNNLANLLDRKGERKEAEDLYRRAMAAAYRVLGPEHPTTALTESNLAILLSSKGEETEAEQLYRRALNARERMLGPDHPDTIASVINLATLLVTKGDDPAAESLLRKLMEGYERTLGTEHEKTLSTVINLAKLLLRIGKDSEAHSLYYRAIEGYERFAEKDDLTTLGMLLQFGPTLREAGKLDEAEVIAIKGRESCKKQLEHGHENTALASVILSSILLLKGRWSEAREEINNSWQTLANHQSATGARLLLLKAVLERLENREAAIYFGQIKAALSEGIQHMGWPINSVLTYLQGRISQQDIEFLDALVKAISNKDQLDKMENFLQWSNQTPISLAEPWPEDK